MARSALQLRRHQQVIAALAALDLDGVSVEPLFAVFANELGAHLALGTSLQLDRLVIGTRIEGRDATVRLEELFQGICETSGVTVGVLDALAQWHDGEPLRLEITEIRGESEPRIRVGFGALRDRMYLWQGLKAVGLPESVQVALDRAGTVLATAAFSELAVVLAPPDGPQWFEVRYPVTPGLGVEPIEELVRAIETHGPQRAWAAHTHTALVTEHPEGVTVTVAAGPTSLLPRVTVRYPAVRRAVVDELQRRFAPQPLGASRVNALAAAAAVKRPVVSELRITTTREPVPEASLHFLADS